jgi:hypothetical protein
MNQNTRAARGAAIPPPVGYGITRQDRRYFPVRIHLYDPVHPGTTAFTRPDGTVVSFAKRLSALVFLYQQTDRTAQTLD